MPLVAIKIPWILFDLHDYSCLWLMTPFKMADEISRNLMSLHALNPLYFTFQIVGRVLHIRWLVRLGGLCLYGVPVWRWVRVLGSQNDGCSWLPSLWRHQMEAFSALLALRAGNSPVTGEFPSQRPVTRSFDVFFDLNKQSWGWWFGTPSRSLWSHCNVS